MIYREDFEEHEKGLNKSCFTYKRRPVKLIFYQEFNDVNQAISFEKKLKDGVLRRNLLWQMEILICYNY